MKDVGRYDAPPIKDGRIKDPELMQDKLRTLIESSVKTSIVLFVILWL
jgi:actin-like ATPase involved in cell morphogenesis